MTPAQTDIRWFYWAMGEAGIGRPSSAEAEAFAERVAIQMEAAGLTLAQARAEAIAPYLQPDLKCPPEP